METIKVEQIHREWFSAAEELSCRYSEERIEKLSNKLERLKSLGFGPTKDNDNLQEVIDAARVRHVIDQFAVTHPNNKVISKRDVNRLCDKYGLIYGELTRFMGFVPEKNLQEIEKFYHKDLNTWLVGTTNRWFNGLNDAEEFFTEIAAQQYFDNLRAKRNAEREAKRKESRGHNGSFINFVSFGEREEELVMRRKGEFLIAAPRNQMQVNIDEQVVDNQIVKVVHYPDPVVLFPIDGGDHFLIVTAWGDEASDEIVVNHKMN